MILIIKIWEKFLVMKIKLLIDYLSKKRDREEYNDELFVNFAYENENKKYHTNDYYNRIMFENKEDNYDNNEDDIKKMDFCQY